ncbi:Mov34/MPN/PAD-1 family protein, partial [Novipirellula aureliae]|uniref:Mov34/MPN/PAD-1 family protein n=1 Tax=Novipirellula aureliae TaxID=2527966 RepID=UPI0011B5D534
MIALKNKKPKRRQRRVRPRLRFSPYAWSKLLCLRDAGPSEVGGFGISDADDPLLIIDVELVRQRCTAVTVEFDDESVADFFDRQVDEGRSPDQFARIWIHTHPGCSALPSGTDEDTFDRSFSAPDWAVMFILAQNGATYGRLRYNVGPTVPVRLDAEVDYTHDFPASDPESWLDAYDANVVVHDPFSPRRIFDYEADDSIVDPMETNAFHWDSTEWVAS